MKDEDDRIPGLERLRMERLPARDLWPGIAARIKRRRPRWSLALAAALAVAVLATVIATRLPQRHGPAPDGDVPAVRTVAANALRPLSQPSRQLVRANLKIVNDGERQLRRALKSDPDAGYLQSLLVTAEAQRRALHEMLSDERG